MSRPTVIDAWGVEAGGAHASFFRIFCCFRGSFG